MTVSERPAARRTSVPPSTIAALEDAYALLRESGIEDVPHDIDRRRAAMAARPLTIVVVGEISRGKSSLVNALLGIPNLAPVGDQVTTAVSVTFSPARADLPEGTARLLFASGEKRIDVAELHEWVTVNGRNALTDEATTLRSAEVGIRSDALPDVTVIDTPGSGGLSAAHAARALQTAERAAILIVVTDAGGRITRDALRFLNEAASFAGHVIIAVNKIDMQRHDWPRILDEDREILQSHAQAVAATFVGVSSLDAEKAMTVGDGAEVWLQLSRLGELREVLSKPIARAARLPEIAALRQLRAPLENLHAELAGEVLAVTGADQAILDLKARQAELERLGEDGSAWRFRMNRGLKRIRNQVARTTIARIDAFELDWQARISKGIFGISPADMAVQRQEMRDQVDEISTRLREELTFEVEGAVRDLFASAQLDPPDELSGVLFDDASSSRDDVEPASGTILQMLGVAMLATGPARLLPFPLGLPVAAAGLIGGLFISKRLKNRVDAQQALVRLARELRERAHADIGDAVDHLSIDVAEAFDAALRRRTRQVSAQVAEATKLRTASIQERGQRVKAVRAKIDRLEKVNAAVATEFTRLAGNLAPDARL